MKANVKVWLYVFYEKEIQRIEKEIAEYMKDFANAKETEQSVAIYEEMLDSLYEYKAEIEKQLKKISNIR